MTLIEPRSVTGEVSRAERALQFPVGAASPLWILYAGAASAGMAYWLITRWAKPVNLEALLGAGKAAATAAIEASAPVAEAVLLATEAAEETLEAAVEEAGVIERSAEAAQLRQVDAAEPEPAVIQLVTPEPTAVLEPTEIIDAPAKPKPVRKPRAAKPSADG